MPDRVVRAAGGIVVRNGGSATGDLEFAAVHRARYRDWSLPKGKLHPGESEEEGALREVEEETGLICRLVRRIDTVEYRDRQGRRKTVAYWLMEVVGGELRPAHEIDRVAWVPAGDAAQRLSYGRDVDVVRRSLGASDALPPGEAGI